MLPRLLRGRILLFGLVLVVLLVLGGLFAFNSFGGITGDVVSSEGSVILFNEQFNLEMPSVPTKSFRFFTLSVPEPSVSDGRVIVILKEPKDIALWEDNLVNLTESELKIIASFMNKYSQNQVDSEIIAEDFKSFNGFSANLSSSDVDSLLLNPFVDKILKDELKHPLMQDNVRLVNSDKINFLQYNSEVNLTGRGQGVCIIDTGIYAAHPDLGNCNLSNSSTTWEVNVSYTSPNYPSNYSNYLDITTNITVQGADAISLYFDSMDIELHPSFPSFIYDVLYVYDKNLELQYYYSGKVDNYTTSMFYGDTALLRFYTNNVGTRKGYNISKIIAYKFYTGCNRIVAGYNSVSSEGSPFNIIDSVGHGTHVVGIIAANGALRGIAPESNIIFVSAWDDSAGGFYNSDVARGIDYCISRANDLNISVISMSLGSGLNDRYCDSSNLVYSRAINMAVANNISVVVATGNDGNYTHITSPACIQNVTRVGSSSKLDSISPFSNRNSLVSLIAPGGNGSSQGLINSTCLPGNAGYSNGYCGKQGTSMAAPLVAGAIILINQYLSIIGQTLTPQQIEDLLANTGVLISDSLSSRVYYRPDVDAAIKSLDSFNPIVQLISPLNNTILTSNLVEFICNFSAFQLENITFNLNSSQLNYSEHVYSSNSTFNFNKSFSLPSGNYSWNCLACDWKDKCSFYAQNYNLTINSLSDICTSFNYSDWSECNSSNLKTRTLNSSSPVNCTGGLPILTQECTFMYHGNLTIVRNNTLLVKFNYTNSTVNLREDNFQIEEGRFLDKSYLIVYSNISYSSLGSKTIYLNVSSNSSGICFRDEKIHSLAQLKGKCTYLECPGSTEDYRCLESPENIFIISGLRHSGVIEMTGNLCGDGVCTTNETCSSCAGDCGTCTSGETSSWVQNSINLSTNSSKSSVNSGSYSPPSTSSPASPSISFEVVPEGKLWSLTNSFIDSLSDFYKDHKLIVLYSLAGLVVLIIIVVIIIVIVSKSKKKKRMTTESSYVMDNSFKESVHPSETKVVPKNLPRENPILNQVNQLLNDCTSAYMKKDLVSARNLYNRAKEIYEKNKIFDERIQNRFFSLFEGLK